VLAIGSTAESWFKWIVKNESVGGKGTGMMSINSREKRRPLAYEQWIDSLACLFIMVISSQISVRWRLASGPSAVQSGLPSVQGMEGVSEGRITEIPPGGTLPPMQFALGETVYVLDGQGLTTVSSGNGPKRTFEWQTHSMFHLPRYSCAS